MWNEKGEKRKILFGFRIFESNIFFLLHLFPSPSAENAGKKVQIHFIRLVLVNPENSAISRE